MDLIAAINDPELFAPWFNGPSWDPWRTVLKAANAAPLTAEELEFFRSVAERDPPEQPVSELWVQGGRRCGKDSIASVAAAAASLEDYAERLRPGERAVVLCLACDRDQSRIVHGYIRAYFERIPMLKAMATRETATGLELNNGVDIAIGTNSYRAVRGRTLVCVIFDEVAFWRDETSAAPDLETYRAVKPGLATVPGSLLIGISSPYRKSGLLYTKCKAHFGKNDPKVLFVKGPSRVFNPTIPQEVVDAAIADDPEAAQAEWLGEPRGDLADFVTREAIDACVSHGVTVRAPLSGVSYFAFVDPSGGSVDSMTLAIAHRESDRAVVDCIAERRAPFSPDSVTNEFAELCKAYRISKITGDRYAGEWPRERFRANGITYEPAELNRSELYLAFLPLINSGRIDLLDNARMIAQFVGLERRTSRAGRDTIDHAPGGHDDIANAVAGVAELAKARRTMDITPEMVAAASRPVPGMSRSGRQLLTGGVNPWARLR